MYHRKLYEIIASTIQARINCQKSGNMEWEDKHKDTLTDIERNELPSGSGIDCGTKILLDECREDKIVLLCEFHHMNENGFYDGWTEHKIIITPSLVSDIDIHITGKDRNHIKEYLADTYNGVLRSTDYSIKQRYEIRRESDKTNKFEITSEWIENRLIHTCNGIQFSTINDARIYAIGEMDKIR